ncbi:hypothetical protein FB451DRAFT_1485424 [Mycena latifolia]|nr:hypothetical protein FB451DRAFT_1485424 [Mycena latifolia]
MPSVPLMSHSTPAHLVVQRAGNAPPRSRMRFAACWPPSEPGASDLPFGALVLATALFPFAESPLVGAPPTHLLRRCACMPGAPQCQPPPNPHQNPSGVPVQPSVYDPCVGSRYRRCSADRILGARILLFPPSIFTLLFGSGLPLPYLRDLAPGQVSWFLTWRRAQRGAPLALGRASPRVHRPRRCTHRLLTPPPPPACGAIPRVFPSARPAPHFAFAFARRSAPPPCRTLRPAHGARPLRPALPPLALAIAIAIAISGPADDGVPSASTSTISLIHPSTHPSILSASSLLPSPVPGWEGNRRPASFFETAVLCARHCLLRGSAPAYWQPRYSISLGAAACAPSRNTRVPSGDE